MRTKKSSGRASINSRTLRGYILLSIISGAAIILLFCFLETRQIRQRAAAALREVMVLEDVSTGKVSPDVFYFSTIENSDNLIALERDLLAYYKDNRDDLEDEKVYHFVKPGENAYFFLRTQFSEYGSEDEDQRLVVYVDVSFSVDIVRSAALVMALIFLVFAFVLYMAGRRIIRILDQKDCAMRDFFANASHELKTPLMAIRGYTDGLREGIVDEKKTCEVIDRETGRMSRLINEIMEISKVDSGMVRLHREDNDVREILYDAISGIELTARQKNIRIRFDLPDPIIFSCDEELMYSVFSNILSNSVRYAGSEISILAERKSNPDGLEIRIGNDGIPISEQDREHIFERFYRGNSGQTGIGMALSREYTRLHGGDITAAAENGKTVFIVRL